MEVFFEKLADTRLVKTSEGFQVVISFQIFRSKFCAYLKPYSPRPPFLRNHFEFIYPAVFLKELTL